jgi:hypothetical protein
MVVLFVQIIVPFLLLLFQIRESVRFPGYNTGNVSSTDLVGLFATDWETFCYQPVAVDALIINFVIFLVYTIRVS